MSDAQRSEGAAGPLRLVGLQQAGLAFDFEWRWPYGERVQWLHHLLGEAAAAVPASRDGFAAFSLSSRCASPTEPSQWWLCNHAGPLNCAVNGALLLPGCERLLQSGDEIEVGLIRLLVLIEAMPEADRFDLATLDAHPASTTPGDFSDLIAPVPWPLPEAPTAVDPSAPAAADPLEALHAQYLAKLHNPLHVDEGPGWQDLVRGDRAVLVHPVQHWVEAAGEHGSLEDLLGQSCGIEAVMASLDGLGVSDVLAPAPFDNVLQLFAPETLHPPSQDALGQSLPSLTRREHHSLSPDSAIPLFHPSDLTSHLPESTSP